MTHRNLRYGYLGLLIVLAVGLFALLGPARVPYDPNFEDSHHYILDPRPPHPPSAVHPLGTDEFSRDILTRLAYGAKYTLLLGLGVATLRLLVGLLGGFLVAYGPKVSSRVLSWLYVLGSGLPPLIIYYVLFQRLPVMGYHPDHPGQPLFDYAFHGTALILFSMLVMAVVESPRVMVAFRGRLEQLMHEPFYEGAIAVGNTRWGAFRRHLLPNLWTTIAALLATETARALLTVGALGLLQVRVMGARLEIDQLAPLIPGRSNPPILTGLYPEWSSILADCVRSFRAHPWLPFIPATALMILVLGFGLLARGAEPLWNKGRRRAEALSAALTQRGFTLRRRWVAAAVLAVGVYLWTYQGLPWGQEGAVNQVIAQQQQALLNRDIQVYLRTIDPQLATFRAEQEHYLASMLPRLVGKPIFTARDLTVQGQQATATVTLTLPLPEGPHYLVRQAVYQRRLGSWYDAGYAAYTFRSLHTRVTSQFPLVDRNSRDFQRRLSVLEAIGVLDRVMQHVAEAFPGLIAENGPLPVTFFATEEEFRASLGVVPVQAKDLRFWWAPGESLRMSPGFLTSENFPRLAAEFDEQMAKLLALQHGDQVTPVIMVGAVTSADQLAGYRVNYSDSWAGRPVLSLPDLLALTGQELNQPENRPYTVQALYLLQWLKSRDVPPSKITQAMLQKPTGAQETLARAMKMSVTQLQAAYQAETRSYLQSLSLLPNPNFRERFDPEFLRYVQAYDQEVARQLGVESLGSELLKIEPIREGAAEPRTDVYSLVRYRQGGKVVEGVERWALRRKMNGDYTLDVQNSLLLLPLPAGAGG